MELLILFLAVNVLLVIWRGRHNILANIYCNRGISAVQYSFLMFGSSYFNQALRYNPDHAKANFWIGMTCAKNGEYANSRRSFLKAYKADPSLRTTLEKLTGSSDVNILANLAMGFDRNKISFPNKALARYVYGLDDNIEPLLSQALIANDAQTAEKVVKCELALNPNNLKALIPYAGMLYKKNDYYGLCEINARIKRLAPNYAVKTLKSPEEIERERQKMAQEMEEIRRREEQIALEETYAIAFDEDGCYSMKDMMEACRKLLGHGDLEPAARNRLGMLYYECGRYYSAKVELEEAAKLDPSLKEEALIAELIDIVKELERLVPKQFVPKPSISDYGVDAEGLDSGKVVDVFRVNGLRAISVKFGRVPGDDRPMFYRYQTLFYNADDRKPSYVVRLEVSMMETCCITKTGLKTGERSNFGAGHEDMAYEEFKYQVMAVMGEMRPPMMTSQPDEPNSNSKEE